MTSTPDPPPDYDSRPEAIRRAIEVRDGRVRNPAILAFQGRAPEHPYAVA